MFLRAEDCSDEVKDSKFIVDILISAIEQVGPTNVVQVITDNAPICDVAGLIVESRYYHIFWTPCIVHNLNLILEEIEEKTEWIKEVTGQAREIIKFITNHHQSQAMEFLLKFTLPAFELLQRCRHRQTFLGRDL
jgi:oligoribonuclease NrnB/cAMP/cGMP phosphodiesterase (DHH superfamily)